MVPKNLEMHNGDLHKVQQAHYGKLRVFLKDTESKRMQTSEHRVQQYLDNWIGLLQKNYIFYQV
ncbi:hypothetical protein D3C85_951170 [compost metagenome]